MNNKEQKLAEQIKNAISKICCDYYNEEGIESGDITPIEELILDGHIEDIAKLIYKIGEFNKEV